MIKLQVTGMSCGHCVKAVTQAVQQILPAAVVNVDLSNGLVTVDQHTDRYQQSQLLSQIAAAGYPATLLAS